MFGRVLITVALLLFSFQIVIAHDVWIGKRDGGLVVFRGHGPDKIEPYDPGNVKEPLACNAKGEPIAAEIVKAKEEASVAPKTDPAIVGAVYEGGYWLKTTDGCKKTTRTEAKGKFDIIEALKGKACCKMFLGATDSFAKPMGQFFEITPMKDPTTVRSGEKLAVKVLLEGKPLEGAVVTLAGGHESDTKDPLKTDKDGMATVAIEKPGMQMVKAGYKLPIKGDVDADLFYLSSTITFDAQ